jgi:RimJ/RimL family protein N-acetyltransferase
MRNPILVGTRVYLRPMEAGDAITIAEHTAKETETFMYRGRGPMSPIAFERWITELHKQQPPQEIVFAVCLRADDRCIGVVGISEIDWVHRTAETFSELGPATMRGQGYGTDAKHLLLEYCFDHIHLHAIRSFVAATNTRSMAALARQGYRPAGTIRWVDVKHGVYQDDRLFDLLRDEWLAAHAAWLQGQST